MYYRCGVNVYNDYLTAVAFRRDHIEFRTLSLFDFDTTIHHAL